MLRQGPPPQDEMADAFWMERALEMARHAESLGEVPVGAVLVDASGILLGTGWNQPIQSHDPTAHAEIIALRQAAQMLKNYRLSGGTLYVTLEPCAMCAGAMLHARIQRLVYGADDPKAGAVRHLYTLLSDSRLNHTVEVRSGVEAEASSRMLKGFFMSRRGKKLLS